MLHWHGDNLDLPANAERLASTKICPTQAFTIGTHVLGLQFHIETKPQMLESWLIGHAANYRRQGYRHLPCARRRRDPARLRLPPVAVC